MGLRLGVVGTGYWAREIHLPGLLGMPSAEVVGLWARNPATTKVIADQHGIRSFPNLQDLLDSVDAVSVAVHPEAQADIAVAAANAGKHLILEKPLSLDPISAERVVTAIQVANVASMVFFIRRFIPEIAQVLARERHRGWTTADVRVHSSVMVTDSPYRDSEWRQKPESALWDIGPHVLSILIPMLGKVVDIEAQLSSNHITTLRTAHEGGGAATISLTLHSSPDQTANSYRFIASSREVVLPDPPPRRVEAFRRAAERLLENVARGQYRDECGAELGGQIVVLLAQADRHLRKSS